MTERETLMHACLNEPADDTARLVYADFLRDQESPLGRFIWAGVTLSRFRGNDVIEDGMFFDAQRELHEVAEPVLSQQLDDLFNWRWADLAWDTPTDKPDRLFIVRLKSTGPVEPPTPGGYQFCPGMAERTARSRNYSAAIYERGMLCGLRMPLRSWHLIAAKVLAVCPLEFVEVIDVPGLHLRIALEDGKWRLTGELKLPAVRLGQPRQPARTLLEHWSIGVRDRFAHYIRTATDDTIELLRMEAGDHWPVPATNAEFF